MPWVEEAILGDFYFAGDNREEAPKIADSTRPFDIADPDAVFWRTITEMETTDEKRAGLNLYLDVFPTGQFAGEAQGSTDAYGFWPDAARPLLRVRRRIGAWGGRIH